MNRNGILAALVAAITLVGCGSGGSQFPDATGKASIRGINAMSDAHEVLFKIEERTLAPLGYQSLSPVNRYDDLNYNFNFDVRFSGDDDDTRLATMPLDVIKDKDYVFVVTGTVANPSMLLWEADERIIGENEMVFEVRFAHTSNSMGAIDVYFDAPGVAPALGNEVGTLSLGDILQAQDFDAATRILTITTSGDPSDILFQSDEIDLVVGNQYIVTPFDSQATANAPFIVRALTSIESTAAGSVTFTDVRFPPSTEFFHAAPETAAVDVYDDELLTSLVVANQSYGGLSGEIDVNFGATTYRYTPANDTGTILLEDEISAIGGLRSRVVALGAADNLRLASYVPDRRSVATQAKLQFFNANNNFDFVDIYVVDEGASIDEEFPSLSGASAGIALTVIPLVTGSYDVYVTNFATPEEVLAGPATIDVTVGDTLGGILLDDPADPAVISIQFLPQ